MVKKIPLSQGKVTIVNDGDFEWLSQWKWYYHGRYAVKNSMGGGRVYMHRLIIQTPDGMHTDHINGNSLDNRRCNLRIATCSQNLMNQHKKRSGCSSRYKGVFWSKNDQLWVTQISINKKRYTIGYSKSETDAGRLYNEAALFYYKEFAQLNIIEGE